MDNKREQTIMKHYQGLLEQEQKYRATLHNENIIIARKNNELKKQLKQDARIIIDLQKDLDYWKNKSEAYEEILDDNRMCSYCGYKVKDHIKDKEGHIIHPFKDLVPTPIPNCTKCGFPKFKNHTCSISNKPVLMSDRLYFKKVKNKLTGRDEWVRK